MTNQNFSLQREARPRITQLTLAQLETLRASCGEDKAPAQWLDSGAFQALMLGDLQNVTPCTCQPGEIICQEDEPGDMLYFIRSGRAAIVKGSFEAPVVLACRGAGEFVGEMALLEDMPRSASVVALDHMQLLSITREDFLHLLSGNIKLDLGLLRKMSSQLRDSDNAVLNIAQARRTLTSQVSELTTENRQLLELQRLREQTTELIIHDLRNPLQGITGAVNMLRMTLPADLLQENDDLFQLIIDNGNRMQRLIDSLLDISRLEAGEAKLALESSNLAMLLEAAVTRNQPVMQARGISARLNLPPDLPMVPIDVYMIDRVVTNLVDNAIKFIPGTGEITVSAEPCNDMVQVSINDTGFGIPPEQREYIFDRFARGTNSSKQQQGFGLGLTFCRLAVEAHGGRIWMEEGDGGRGSKCVFTLPLELVA